MTIGSKLPVLPGRSCSMPLGEQQLLAGALLGPRGCTVGVRLCLNTTGTEILQHLAICASSPLGVRKQTDKEKLLITLL